MKCKNLKFEKPHFFCMLFFSLSCMINKIICIILGSETKEKKVRLISDACDLQNFCIPPSIITNELNTSFS